MRRFRFALFQSGPLAVVGTTLVVWPFLGRSLPPVQVGALSSVLAVSSILAPVVTLGAHLHVANRLARDPHRIRGAEGRLVTGLLVILSVLALSSLVALVLVHDSAPIRIAAVVFATGCSILVVGVVRGLDRAASFAALTLWAQFVALLLLAVVAQATDDLDAGIGTYVLALVVCAVAVVPVLMSNARAGRSTAVDVSAAAVGRLGVKSARLVPHLVLAVATLLVARIIVGLIAGPVGLAGFQYASLLIGGVTTIGASLDAHWSTRAQAAGDEVTLRAALNRNLVRIQVLLAIVAAGVVFFVFVLLPFWLPPAYDATAVRAAVLVSLSAGAFQALADNRSAALMWFDRSGAVSTATSVGVAVTAISCVVLVAAGGWVFAGAAIALGTAARAACAVVLLRRVSGAVRLGTGTTVTCTVLIGVLLLASLLTSIR